MNIALFASGKGSNVENILSCFSENKKVNILFIATNNLKSGAINHAKSYNIPLLTFKKLDLTNTNKLVDKLNNNRIELIVLAGFLLKIPEEFISQFNGKIINIHPSLLPKYGGKGMYGDHIHKEVLKNKEKETGITFHFVNENYDEGEIISQNKILIDESETIISLKTKINQLELLNYPRIIRSFLDE
ncbi:MAG: phosphoribosylglycinamide formyltransferase [Crocinitomicaceae bacterium]|nr:phosphoribosylglycinamide formyltransferase [Crocinitomicaceae bacterium]